MAADSTYGNLLRKYVTDPGSFKGSAGYQFALDQGLQGVNRSNARIRGSGNALAALTKYASGLASQDYGNTIDQLGKLTGQEEQYGLGLQANDNTATRNANDLLLGREANANTATRNANDLFLGKGNLELGKGNLGLGLLRANQDYSLGRESNANTAQNNWFNYDLGRGRNANDRYQINTNYDLGTGRNNIDWLNAYTNLGTARSSANARDQATRLAWYQALPRSGTNPVTGGAWYSTGG